MRAALGGEAAVHDRERALGVGAVDRGREREVRAQAVIARAIVELDVHPQEPFAGAQLEVVTMSALTRSSLRALHERSSPTARAGQRVAARSRRRAPGPVPTP